MALENKLQAPKPILSLRYMCMCVLFMRVPDFSDIAFSLIFDTKIHFLKYNASTADLQWLEH